MPSTVDCKLVTLADRLVAVLAKDAAYADTDTVIGTVTVRVSVVTPSVMVTDNVNDALP